MNTDYLQRTVLLLNLFTAPVALGNESDCLVDAYLHALEQTQQENAQPADIDALLDFYAEVGYIGRERQLNVAYIGISRNAV
ncbi:MAG: hypothetical protein V3T39_06850 [Gammaproteobacteria bacterium]